MHRTSRTLISLFIMAAMFVAIPAHAMAESTSWEIGSNIQGFVPQPPDGFKVDKGAYFDIYYNANNFTPMDLGGIYTNMSYAYTAVVNFYGEYPYHTKVILVANGDEYRYILQNANLSDEETGDGYGDGNKGTILIKSPELVSDFKSQMSMDMARIATRSNLTDNKYDLPAWFSEGMAMYVSGNLDDSKRQLIEDRYRSGRLMTVDQLDLYEQRADYPETNSSDLEAAEAQSGLIVEYIAQQYGNQSLLDMLKSFSKDRNLDAAFINVTQKSPDGINIDWQRQLGSDIDVRDGKVLSERVRGYVTDSRGKPMAYQTIAFTSLRNDSSVVYGKVYEGTTDDTGYYDVNVTYGLMNVQVDSVGYPVWDDNFTVGHKENKFYNVTLNATALEISMAQKAQEEYTRDLMYIVLGAFNLLAIVLVLVIFRKSKK
jgi:hypothetical protein